VIWITQRHHHVHVNTFTVTDIVAQMEGEGMARILVLDRTSSVREALALVLELEGHTVEQVATGGEALTQLGEGHFDVVLADTHLRDIPFTDFCQGLRSIAPSTRFVTMSMNRADSAHFERCAPAAFLAKPFAAPSLFEAVGVPAAA
jgi:CheY-like chemotaxis protein